MDISISTAFPQASGLVLYLYRVGLRPVSSSSHNNTDSIVDSQICYPR